MTINSILVFIGILLTLVTVHELGHFMTAKFFKMKVEEFAFGFPPNLLKKKIGETVYSLNLIPLGGYVKILGENGMDEEDYKKLHESDKKRLFSNKIWWQKIVVLSGGVVFNILCAIFLFTFAFMYGSNIYLNKDELATTPASERKMTLVDLNDKSPLKNTEISLGDTIVRMEADGAALDSESLNSTSAADFIQAHNDSRITIYFKNNDGFMNQIFVIPRAGIVDGKKILGAKFADQAYKKYGFIESLNQSIKITYEQLIGIFSSLWELINNIIFKNAKVEDNLSGPIGLAVMTTKVAQKGLDQIFIFAAMLSLSLAAFNILPIPALDGGRIFFVLVELTIRKKIKASTEQIFHGVGFLALLGLMVFVSYFDIVKAFIG